MNELEKALDDLDGLPEAFRGPSDAVGDDSSVAVTGARCSSGSRGWPAAQYRVTVRPNKHSTKRK